METLASIPIAMGVDSCRKSRFFCVAKFASGWCKVLKALHGFNLTVIYGRFSTGFSTELLKTS